VNLRPHSQPALDALRALAAFAVLVTHVGFQTGATQQGTWGAVTARFDVGVAIFFVLSGYLLTLPHVRAADQRTPAPDARRYLWHRAIRILPAYWAACLAAVLLLPENDGVSRATVLRNLGLVQIYRRGDLLQGFTQTWSLCTEVVFYLLLPLLGVWLVRSLRRGHVASVVVTLAALVVLNEAFLVVSQGTTILDRGLTGFWLPSFTSWFAGGMALAVLRNSEHPRVRRIRAWLDSAAAAPLACWTIAVATLLVAATPLAGPRGFEAEPTAGEAIAKNLLYLAVAVLLMIPVAFGLERPSAFRRRLSSRSWRFLGEISYGVFLWHLTVLALVLRLLSVPLFGGDFVPVLVLTTAGSLLIATASLVVLERPALRLRDRGPGRRGQPRSTVATGPSRLESPEDGGTVATAATAPAKDS